MTFISMTVAYDLEMELPLKKGAVDDQGGPWMTFVAKYKPLSVVVSKLSCNVSYLSVYYKQ